MFKNHAPPRFANPPKPPRPVPRMDPTLESIFKITYRVLLKNRDLRSIEEQRLRPDLSTGDKRVDSVLGESLVPAYITINDMVEYYRDGVVFHLTDSEAPKKIYEAVTEHTGRWREALQYSMNISAAPVEDLILMEQFVSSIYEYARFEYAKRPAFDSRSGTLTAFLYSGSGLSSGTFMNGETVKSALSDGVKPEDQRHNPDISVFQRAIVESVGANRERD